MGVLQLLFVSAAICLIAASQATPDPFLSRGAHIQMDGGSVAYDRLANAMSDIDATLTYELQAGRFRIHNCGDQIFMVVHPQTRASFRFTARQGQLRSAQIQFSAPISVSWPYAQAISSLLYDFDRRVLTVNGATQVALFLRDHVWNAQCASFLNLDRQLSQALRGRPWPELVRYLDNKAAHCRHRPIVIRTSLETSGDRGLPVTFIAGAELGADTYSSDRGFRILVGKAGHATLRSLWYSPEMGAIAYDLSNFSCESIAGTIACTDARLNIAPKGAFNCRSIILRSNSFQVKGGTLDCALDRGSKLVLNRSGPVPSRIVLDSGSSLKTPELTYVADGHDCSLSLGAGSSGTLRIFDGVLAVTDRSALRVDRGYLIAGQFVGTWGDREPSTFSAVIDQLDLAIAGGAIELTKSMPLVLLSDGHIVGSGLHMSSDQLPSVVGSLSEFRVTLANDSTFSMPVGFCFAPTGNGSLTALEKVLLRAGPNPLKGEFVVDTTFSRLANHEFATFTLADGHLMMPFSIDDNGVLSTPATTQGGDTLTRISNATFVAKESEGGALFLTVTISRGKLLCDPITREFKFDALWSGQINHLAFETADIVDSFREGDTKAGLLIRNSVERKCGFWDRPLAFNGTAVSSVVPMKLPCVVGERELSSGNAGRHAKRHKVSFDDLFRDVEFQASLSYQAHSLKFAMRATTNGGPNIEAGEPVIDWTLYCATDRLFTAPEQSIASQSVKAPLTKLPLMQFPLTQLPRKIGHTYRGHRLSFSLLSRICGEVLVEVGCQVDDTRPVRWFGIRENRTIFSWSVSLCC